MHTDRGKGFVCAPWPRHGIYVPAVLLAYSGCGTNQEEKENNARETQRYQSFNMYRFVDAVYTITKIISKEMLIGFASIEVTLTFRIHEKQLNIIYLYFMSHILFLMTVDLNKI